ncbi:SUMO-activating enzyme subunit 1 isoform X1 [Gopherus evgoodei]|uniref:SUMO-activating enzyme subunit 1 n=1 Tax=Gopherus evgoodei TaxID=1825980 RepID=A0A8C4YHP9_9SAUR|nr:SUMO-activating enzyme subunit 1 isoform X1 [Gopherus evgoodei]
MVEQEGGGSGGISEEEAAQYDRQIRLWGLAAQRRLRASRVLLVGMKGLGAEVAKNLILAGVKGLTMLDHQQVSQQDTRAQFLIPVGSLGRNRAEASLERAQNLNPMVDVKADPENIENKAEDFFTQFDAVCLTCCSRCVMVKVDQICHRNSIKFFTGDIFGYYGYMFANLGAHEFVEEKTKVTKASQGVEDGPDTKKAKLDSTETTMVKKRVVFCQLKEALAVDWSSEKAKAALKRTAPDYFLLQVLLKFRADKGRDPLPESYAEDAELLLQMRNEVLDSLGVGAGLLPDDFVRPSPSGIHPTTTSSSSMASKGTGSLNAWVPTEPGASVSAFSFSSPPGAPGASLQCLASRGVVPLEPACTTFPSSHHRHGPHACCGAQPCARAVGWGYSNPSVCSPGLSNKLSSSQAGSFPSRAGAPSPWLRCCKRWQAACHTKLPSAAGPRPPRS